MRDELAAVVMPQCNARGDADVVVPLGRPDCFADTFDCFEARATKCSTHAETFTGAMIDENEDCGIPFVGHTCGGVDGPHDIRLLRHNSAIVYGGTSHGGRTIMREKFVLSHESKDSASRALDAVCVTQLRPDLAMAFADEV